MEKENTNPAQTAICKACGHTWTPRNPETKNRKCSKCGSQDISYETESMHDPNTDPTPEELAKLINQSIEPEEEEDASTELEPFEDATDNEPVKTGFKIHPTLIFIGMAAVLAIGAAFFFRWRGKKQVTPPIEEEQEEKPTRAIRPTIVHYANEN